MKICIIDDEPKAIEVLQNFAERIPEIHSIETFRSSIKAASYLNEHTVDVIFLDIDMPNLSGIELLKTLGKPSCTIFTTAYSKYAVESYEMNALDYLMKPIEFDRFFKAVNKARKQLGLIKNSDLKADNIQHNESVETIYLKSGTQYFQVKMDDIMYLEKKGNYLIFHTTQNEIPTRQNISDVYERLNREVFIRIHKSFIVSRNFIEMIDSYTVKINDTELSLGRSYKDEVYDKLGLN